MTAAYPLSWPETFPRSKTREGGRFKTALASALANVQGSLKRFAEDSGKSIGGVVLSSNVTLGVAKPADPGVAVWFSWDGLQVCIPVDRYTTPEANLQAVHHVIEARRTEMRHGTLALVRATMKGFVALPGSERSSWWRVLGVEPTASKAEIEAAYRKLAPSKHPDTGGSQAAMSELNQARDTGLKEAARG